MNLKIVLVVILVSLFLIITLQNTEMETFTILFWKIDMSRIVFMYLSVLIGFLAGYILAKFTSRRKPAEKTEFGEYSQF
jgi:uncharacterized integral membrane protein